MEIYMLLVIFNFKYFFINQVFLSDYSYFYIILARIKC